MCKSCKSIAIILSVFVFILFFSCSSSPKKQAEPQIETEIPPEQPEPVARAVHPFEYFDFNKEMYVTLPVKGNEVFLQALFSKMAPEMSKFAMNQFLSKMTNLYLATTLDMHETEAGILFQFVATGALPKSYRSMLFTKKNGFREVEEKQDLTTYKYFFNSDAEFYVDIPEDGFCFADTDYLSGMLFAREETKNGKEFVPKWPDEVISHLFKEKNDSVIDWYLASTAPLLNQIMGLKMKLPISYALGTMVRRAEQPKDTLLYTLDADLKMVNERFVKPNIPVVKMFITQFQAEGPYPEPVVSAGENGDIIISGLVVDLQKVINLLQTKE